MFDHVFFRTPFWLLVQGDLQLFFAQNPPTPSYCLGCFALPCHSFVLLLPPALGSPAATLVSLLDVLSALAGLFGRWVLGEVLKL